MVAGLAAAAAGDDHAPRNKRFPPPPPGAGDISAPRRPDMQWTTPTATDFRFGFEITMYVAAR